MIHLRVRQARETAKLTQQAIADKAGVPRSQVQLLEKGGNVTRETLEKTLSVFGLTLVAVSVEEIAAARKALQALDAYFTLLGGALPPTGEPDDITPAVRQSIRELDALVDLENEGE